MSHLSDTDYQRLALRLRELMERMDTIPFPAVQDAVFELLQGLDALHREGLARLLDLIAAEAPDVLPRLEEDYVLRTLLMLYDFIPPDETAPPGPQGDGFVPLEKVDVLEAIRRPIWIPGGHVDDLAPGALIAKTFEEVSVLLCRVDDEVFALHNACSRSILPLAQGRLEGHVLTCPWHGCRYDVRTGALLDGSGEAVQTFPVSIGEKGRFSVGFNVES